MFRAIGLLVTLVFVLFELKSLYGVQAPDMSETL